MHIGRELLRNFLHGTDGRLQGTTVVTAVEGIK